MWWEPFDNRLLNKTRSYHGCEVAVIHLLQDLKRFKEAIYDGFGIVNYDRFMASLSNKDKRIISEIQKEWNYKEDL